MLMSSPQVIYLILCGKMLLHKQHLSYLVDVLLYCLYIEKRVMID